MVVSVGRGPRGATIDLAQRFNAGQLPNQGPVGSTLRGHLL